MHILILGAGAMGSLLGARFSRTDSDVTLFSTDREHMEAARKHGLMIEELDGRATRYEVASCSDPSEIKQKADLVLVTVKSYSTRAAMQSIKSYVYSSTLYLTLQNGMGNFEQVAALAGNDVVLIGVTAQGATLVGPGIIRHGGNGPTYIGEREGPPTARVDSLVGMFRKAGFQAEASGRMEELIWEKLLVNVGINAITALTGVKNGAVAHLQAAADLCRAAVEEAMLIAAAKGFPARKDIVERVFEVALATARNRSSMGQDVDKRKPTEIDAINGTIVRFGKEMSIPTPVNMVLTHLIKVVEAGFVEQ